jgi:hypothetical protein
MVRDRRDKQRADLYNRLLKLLSASGKNDAYGKGNFWLLDEDWGDTNKPKV